jgi:hypothetical protein
MKTYFKKFPHFQVRPRTFLTAVALLALSSATMTAGDKKPVPASPLEKLDEQLVLVVKKSRGEAPFDRSPTVQPDVYKFRGRVLVQIEGSISKELSDHIASLGGQVVTSWGTVTTFRAWVPFAQVETLASRPDIKFMSPARPTITHRLRPIEKS